MSLVIKDELDYRQEGDGSWQVYNGLTYLGWMKNGGSLVVTSPPSPGDILHVWDTEAQARSWFASRAHPAA